MSEPVINLNELLETSPIVAWGTKILIVQDAPETQTVGGLVIPKAIAEKHRENTGIVKFVGPFCTEAATQLVGRRVSFSGWAGQKEVISDQEYLILLEENIHAVLRD